MDKQDNPDPPVIEAIAKVVHLHKNQQKLIDHLTLGNQIYIVGPTGSGKSQGVKLAANTLGKKFYKKLVGNQTTETSILGYMDASGRYVEGIAYKPFTEGGILLIDEVDNGNPNTNLVINGLSDRSIAFPCGMREAHEDFMLVATANTVGTGATINYCGRNRLDAALLNRFIFLEWPYDEKLEGTLTAQAYTDAGGQQLGANGGLASLMRDILNIRSAINELNLTHIVSPRTSVQAAKMLASGKFTPAEIFTQCLTKGLDKDTQRKILDKSKSILLKLEEDEKKALAIANSPPVAPAHISYDNFRQWFDKLSFAEKESVAKKIYALYKDEENANKYKYLTPLSPPKPKDKFDKHDNVDHGQVPF